MAVNGAEIPAITNPNLLMFIKLLNTRAPTEQLQKQRTLLQEKFMFLFAECREQFAQEDAVSIKQLKAERTAIGEEALAVMEQIRSLESDDGMRTSMQSPLQSKLQAAQERLRDFVPVNRTTSSLAQIEANETENRELRQAVNECKQSISQNQMGIIGSGSLVRDLRRKYRTLETRSEVITKAISELEKSPSERNRNSSIVWSDGNDSYALEVPYPRKSGRT